MGTFLGEALILSPSQALHQEADVCFGNPGSRHVHDATVWLILQLERRLWRAGGIATVFKTAVCFLSIGRFLRLLPMMVMLLTKVPWA